MGFWQNLVTSYDKNADALKSTYPLSTTSISNKADYIAVIVIDGGGKFIRSDKIEKKSNPTKRDLENITIPASEESLKRTSTAISPYPVFDQYGYLKGEGEKYDAYVAQLKGFSESRYATKQIKAIYRYVAKRTVASDLSGMALKDKTNVVFQVEIPESPQAKVWEDDTFFDAWHQYYLAEKGKSGRMDLQSLDYITGTIQPVATFHPKKISSASPNAKLISGNDKTNYTFRGKFSDSSEAVSIGYKTSQKAHQFLRYLINDRGYRCGEQVILSFTIGSMEKLLPPPVKDKSIWAVMQNNSAQTESDIQINLRAETGFDYADALRKSLGGFGHGKALKQHVKTAVIVLDAVSDKSGRLSITFYRELDRTEYLEKIADWHSGCKWNQKFWSKEKEKYVPYIGAPSVDSIIEAIHGQLRSKDKSFTKIKKAARERLLRCIFDGAFLSTDYVTAAVRRATNPLGITKGGKFDRNGFELVLSTTCALVRKDCQQRKKEDYKLRIELERTDRDYLYGRLLGAADKLEEYVLFKKKKDRIVTAAIRHMQTFAQRPFRTWQTIHGCLNPYIQAVKGVISFNEIQAIMNQFETGDYEKDTPLNGAYLIGYYHERAYIDSLVRYVKNKKKSTDQDQEEETNDRQ